MLVTAQRFEALVRAAWARIMRGLPADLHDQAATVIVVVAERATPQQAAETGIPAAELLGLYEGIALPDRHVDDNATLPDRITLFRAPLTAMCRSERQLAEEVRITLVHELGHFFGFDEDELEERGL